MSENTTPNDLAEHVAAVLDGHHGGDLKAPLAAWTEPHRDGVQIRVVLQRALSGGEDETFLLHAERLDTGGSHALLVDDEAEEPATTLHDCTVDETAGGAA